MPNFINEQTDRELFLALTKTAKKAANAYYNTDIEIMSDANYDELITKLDAYQKHYNWNEAEQLINSVAGGVGKSGDIQHKVPMLSLNKVNRFDELDTFLLSFPQQNLFIMEPKLDGLAISAIYKQGKLVQVATRGTGFSSDDITLTRPTIKNLPETITIMDDIEIRGEVYMSKDDYQQANINKLKNAYNEWTQTAKNHTPLKFEELYKIATTDEKQQIVSGNKRFTPSAHIYKNQRNAASGVLRQEKRRFDTPLSFATYDIYIGTKNGISKTYLEDVRLLHKLGFIPAYTLINKNIISENIIETVENFGEARQQNLQYPTDGSVIKINSYDIREKTGSSSSSPKWAIAYKYPSLPVETIVEDIEVYVRRTGRLSLRARLKPVKLADSTFEYASLHNVSWLSKKDIRIGDTIKLYRANDVIPYIARYIPSKRPQNAVRWTPPVGCPKCGTAWDKTTLLWRCPTADCGIIDGLILAVGREYLDIEGLSEARLIKMNDAELINDIADIFLLTKSQIVNTVMSTNINGEKEIIGEAVGTKIFNEIQKAKNKPLSAVLASLNIRTLGKTFGKRLEKHFGSIQNILNAPLEQIIEVEGIADKKAQIIYLGLKQNTPLIVKLKNAGVTMKAEQITLLSTENIFSGKKIVITGVIPGYSRIEVEKLILRLNAQSSKSVSGTTQYLIYGEDAIGSSKHKKAQQLNVPMMTATEFLKIINTI